jgi:DNA-binding NarL/FixJ family response regulator
VSIRVLLADDQALVRSGFRMILDARPALEVVGEAADGREAAELVKRLEPDVVLMDVRMPDVDGLEATRRIVESGSATRIIVLTTYDADEFVFAALRAGASGFLLKDVGRQSSSRRSGSSRAATRCSRRRSPAGCSTASPMRCPTQTTRAPTSVT